MVGSVRQDEGADLKGACAQLGAEAAVGAAGQDHKEVCGDGRLAPAGTTQQHEHRGINGAGNQNP